MAFLSKLGNRIRHWNEKSDNCAPTKRSEPPGAHRISEDRKLTTKERTLIEWLIANGSSEAKAYAKQLQAVRVVGRCSCGCPTVDLAVGDDQKATTGPSTILADFLGVTPNGTEVGIILHARQGKLCELEIYPLAADATELPTIDSLRNFGA